MSNSKKRSYFHEKPVTRGVYGEFSKIQEELEEAIDAAERGQTLLLRIELANLIGAVKGVADKYGFNFYELAQFSELVSRVRSQEDVQTEDSVQVSYLEKAQSGLRDVDEEREILLDDEV